MPVNEPKGPGVTLVLPVCDGRVVSQFCYWSMAMISPEPLKQITLHHASSVLDLYCSESVQDGDCRDRLFV